MIESSYGRAALPAVCVLVLAGCATVPQPHCASDGFSIDALFDGGGMHGCHFDGDGRAVVELRPENEPINPSPWYALRLSRADAAGPLGVTLDFGDFDARYWPKTSTNGRDWTALPESQVERSADGSAMTLALDPERPVTYLAAQELTTDAWYGDWLLPLGARDDVTVEMFGTSAAGRPLLVARSPARRDAVVLLGRQHPPEVTGALAMRVFLQTVFADTPLARRFRERFQLVAAPLLNPDGVAQGHWRHNINGVDLNRDWGTFTQPETAAFARLLDRMENAGTRPALMLDFHSTRRSLFYTQLPEDFAESPDFATAWLGRARARLPDHEFSHEPRARSTQANTKNWFFARYGIPAITYEIGDEASRDGIRESAVVFAEEMMTLLLERALSVTDPG